MVNSSCCASSIVSFSSTDDKDSDTLLAKVASKMVTCGKVVIVSGAGISVSSGIPVLYPTVV